MNHTLVIGYGNPLRGDDGIGFLAAQELVKTVRDESVKVLAMHQLHPELASEVSSAAFVIFIDARAGIPAGVIESGPVRPATVAPLTFSHHLQPDVLMACTKALYGRCPDACLITFTGASFDFDTGLSDAATRCFPDLLERVKAMLGYVKEQKPPPSAASAG